MCLILDSGSLIAVVKLSVSVISSQSENSGKHRKQYPERKGVQNADVLQGLTGEGGQGEEHHRNVNKDFGFTSCVFRSHKSDGAETF